MKRLLSLLLAAVFLAALPVVTALADPVADPPTLVSVEYQDMGPDSKFFLTVFIPQSAYDFRGTYYGSGSVDVEVYIDGSGNSDWSLLSVFELGDKSGASNTTTFLFPAQGKNPASRFMLRLTYYYINSSGETASAFSNWSAVMRDDSAAPSTQTPPPATGGTTYTNSALGFTLTIPSSWAGKYRVSNLADARTGVRFSNIRNEDAGYGGWLFDVAISNGVSQLCIDWDMWEIGRGNGKVAYAYMPGDVQYNYNNSSLSTEYRMMANDFESIWASIRFTTAPASPPPSSGIIARPSSSSVVVNGRAVAFDAYTINESNYFKLRDLAFTLSGTQSQFDVIWDGARNAISLISGRPYTVMSGEMTARGTVNRTATPNSSAIYIDGRETQLTAYTIEGLNYFMLRDLGRVFNFFVGWDGARNMIEIDTSRGYS